MVKVKEDLTGKQFGMLTVIRQEKDKVTPSGKHLPMWLCQCSCGSEPKIIGGHSLKSGTTVSCGCKKREFARTLGLASKKENPYDLSGDYAIGYTLKGEEYWVDKEDVELLSNYCWYYNDKGYLVTNDQERKTIIYLHRLVMNVLDFNGYDVDHKNHPPRKEHKIDNRKSNLKLVTRSENIMNSHIKTNNTSGATGIDWNNDIKKWRVRITVNYQEINLGFFDKKEDAIQARKDAEIKYFGDHRLDANN